MAASLILRAVYTMFTVIHGASICVLKVKSNTYPNLKKELRQTVRDIFLLLIQRTSVSYFRYLPFNDTHV